MAKHGRHRRNGASGGVKGGRVTPKGTRPPSRPQRWGAGDHGEPDLVDHVRRDLRSADPIPLLERVSGIITLTEERTRRSRDPFGRSSERFLTTAELVDSFIGADMVETTALLTVMAAMTTDDLVRRRVRHELATRAHVLPQWLARLGSARVTGVSEMVHVLGDGDNINIEVDLDGHVFTLVTYIDHNIGTLVKDAFVVPTSVAELRRLTATINHDDPDTTWQPLDPADARARIVEAIRVGAMRLPPYESETWPLVRPLLEWVVGTLPPGGSEYDAHEWHQPEIDRVSEWFLTSEFGRGFDDTDHRGLLDHLVWLAAEYAPGDPLRWSGVHVEMVLVDRAPRKIDAPVEVLARLPDLLRAFIRFSHDERSIRAELTADTLAAVDEYEPEYQRVIRTDRPQGAAAIAQMLLTHAGGPLLDFGNDEPHEWDDEWFEFDPAEAFREILVAATGSARAAKELEVTPLPDEPFEWAGIPDEIRPTVAQVLELCDQGCDALLDVEYRTAARRFLALAARGDPSVFARRARPETAAAAICWIIAKNNQLIALHELEAKSINAHFGITGSSSQRANTLLAAAGYDPYQFVHDIFLGDPDLLASTHRRRLVAKRDQLGVVL